MDEYDEVKSVIMSMAEAKMQINSHKGRIEDVDSDALYALLKGEVDELGGAMEEADIMHIIEEAGDVFNFLVGVVHQQITLYRMRK
jgi:NTP pyrophosphatase (non-canonical NTP hydrolase)